MQVQRYEGDAGGWGNPSWGGSAWGGAVVAGLPDEGVRIDGVAYSGLGGTVQARTWFWAGSRPSRRFLEFDGILRQAGWRWAGLSEERRQAWRAAGSGWSDWDNCLCWLRYYAYPVEGDDAARDYGATQAWRAAQGLGWLDDPPRVLTQPAGDVVELFQLPGPPPPPYPLTKRVVLRWSRGSAPGGAAHYAAVAARPVGNVPGQLRALSKQRWGGLVPVAVGVDVDVSDLLVAAGAVRGLGAVVGTVVIGEGGVFPFG